MDLKTQLVGDKEERAVSPVIGVILMVAITVILAAVIAAFVLDLGQSTGANAQAGVDFSENGDVVSVQMTSIDRADSIHVQIQDDDGSTEWVDPEGNADADDRDPDDGDSDLEEEWDVGSSVSVDSGDPGSDDDDLSTNGGGETSLGDVDQITVIGELDGDDAVIATWN